MTPSRAAFLLLGCSASLLATGCAEGGDDDSKPAAADSATVNIASFKFAPESITVTAGASVTWVNRDKAPHTAENTGEQGPAEFGTARLQRGERKTVTFSEPGRYRYYCIYHRFMEATVTVR